jgi:hypothetical protein
MHLQTKFETSFFLQLIVLFRLLRKDIFKCCKNIVAYANLFLTKQLTLDKTKKTPRYNISKEISINGPFHQIHLHFSIPFPQEKFVEVKKINL